MPVMKDLMTCEGAGLVREAAAGIELAQSPASLVLHLERTRNPHVRRSENAQDPASTVRTHPHPGRSPHSSPGIGGRAGRNLPARLLGVQVLAGLRRGAGVATRPRLAPCPS